MNLGLNFICTLISVTLAVLASGKTPEDREEDDDKEDMRRAVPGEPVRDYPTLAMVPFTSFTCAGRAEGNIKNILVAAYLCTQRVSILILLFTFFL